MRVACLQSRSHKDADPQSCEDIWLRVRKTHLELWAAAGRSRDELGKRLDALRARIQAATSQSSSGSSNQLSSSNAGDMKLSALKPALTTSEMRRADHQFMKAGAVSAE